MPFLSIEFAVFFVCFFALYWHLRPSPQGQNLLLLAAGLAWTAHISWTAAAAVLLFGLFAATVARALTDSGKTARQRKRLLAGGIVLAAANLAFFKYADFFRTAFQPWLGSGADILLPLGISYYTFQTVAYWVALYRGETERLPERTLMLHLAFMPTLTAGPIARTAPWKNGSEIHQGMASQLETVQPRRIIRPALALLLILAGIAKKWWLAGALAENWVDPVFANPLQYGAWTAWTAVYAYTVQLFLDFSGYTDIVLGMAMLLGFRLPQNFDRPLSAHNIREFWNRWHITLSTWIRDYIYIPLGGNRHGFRRTQANLMAAMLLSGLWHGQGWNFLIWGFLHGSALVLLNSGDRLFGKNRLSAHSRLGKTAAVICTFNFVCLAFVVFRTADPEAALSVFRALLPQGWALPDWQPAVLCLLMLAALSAHRRLQTLFQAAVVRLEALPLRYWPLPLAAALCLSVMFAPSGIPDFIYANF